MRCTVVSCARALTRTFSTPCPLMVPEMTGSPACLGIRRLSPVIGAWLISLFPSTITPSIGKRSPARTTRTSPTASASIGTSSSPDGFKRTALFGARSANSVSTARAWSLV